MKLKLVPSPCSSSPQLSGSDCNYSAFFSSSSFLFTSSTHNRRRHSIIAAKSKKNHHHQQGNSEQPTPPRITSNCKQNLRFLKTWKEFQQRKSTTPIPSNSYRKKKAEKEDFVHQDHSDYYSDTNYKNRLPIHSTVPVFLVDGYNVCGYWIKLKKHFMSGKLERARQMLIHDLITFSMLREVKVVVVFDAMMSGLPSHKENFAGIDIVFSAQTSADTWIEKEVSALKKDGCPKVWVVTSDHCQQLAAHGEGAFIWSCKAFVTEMKESQKEVEMMLEEQRSTSFQGTLLKHNLDAEVVDALKNLRQKLSENELKQYIRFKKKNTRLKF